MKSILKLYCLLCLLLVTLPVAAQELTLSGKVLQSGTRKAVSGVKVSINRKDATTTDSSGSFKLTIPKPGTYEVKVSREGYETGEREVQLKKSQYIEFTIWPSNTELAPVVVKDTDATTGQGHMAQVDGTAIYAGKKTELIKLDNVNGNLAANTGRQVYAKVAGLNIWESDGAGIQLDIGGRGLNPSRTSNFNTRQNGYDISADALGYPESYYTPPTEALEQIEIVRGAASLQYGTQFGGMINFKLKEGSKTKPFSIESRQTGGSFGFFNSFNAIGGTKGKFNYYAFYQYKRGDGWRPNADFQFHNAYVHLAYEVSKNVKITGEYTIMNYLAHQPGGLTDVLFEQDPQQSIRERNWFKVRWNVFALSIDWKLGEKTKLNSRFFGLLAQRDALGFLGLISRTDPLTDRDLVQGQFQNFGNETRLIHRYRIKGNTCTFLIGTRIYRGHTQNKQGLANDGYGPDFEYLNPDDLENSDYTFPSHNISVFTENVFQIGPKFSITPGARFEYIYTSAKGYYRERSTDLAGNIIFDQKINDVRSNPRTLALAGIGISFKPNNIMELYGNFSQNYRAITFNDMRIFNPNFAIDPNLKDEKGFTADLGLRSTQSTWLTYDASVFFLQYRDRIGEVLLQDTLLFNLYRFRTNISDSRTYGIETYIEADIWKAIAGKKKTAHSLSVYTNITWQRSEYVNSEEAAFQGKKVELVPELIARAGISYQWKGLKFGYQFSYTAEQFTDATNAPYTPSAINGLIPAYYVMDINAAYTWRNWTIAAGLNNITNNLYFTRRATGYPGPGIIPSDPRNFFVTLGFKW